MRAASALLLLLAAGCSDVVVECGGDGDCPGGQVCVNGICAAPEGCGGQTCGAGQVCAGDTCVDADCEDQDCAEGQACLDGGCAAVSCVTVHCADGEACAAGTCWPATCGGVDCRGGVCVDGACRSRSCVGISCGEGEVCANGACWPTTCDGVTCGADACVEGSCTEPACVGVTCPAGEACAAGRCYPAACSDPCAVGEICDDGACVESHCLGVDCAFGEACARGACVAADCPDEDCGPAEACVDGERCSLAACNGVRCGPGEACAGGGCTAADCEARDCGPRQVCDGGSCIPDACFGRPCPEGQRCAAGGSCAPTSCGGFPCPVGDVCDVDGATCVEPSCVGVACAGATRCVLGACLPTSGPGGPCAPDEVYWEGACTEVPCVGVRCAQAGTCTAGVCPPSPVTCQSLGASCGLEPDGSGGVLDCGACPVGQLCGPARACEPTGCATLSCVGVCGPVDDPTCGGSATCGACPAPGTARPMPDSATVTCFDGVSSAPTACPPPGDATYGQDGTYLVNPPFYEAVAAGVVRDAVTGLEWTQGVGPRLPHAEAPTYCASVAAAGGGFRLPSRLELATLLDLGQFSEPLGGEQIRPAIDPAAFPNTPASPFWTGGIYEPEPLLAWSVDFLSGGVFPSDREASFPVRCVRGSLPPQVLSMDAETVTDHRTGLVWEREPVACGTWREALARCEALALGGSDAWRLPTVKELLSLAGERRTADGDTLTDVAFPPPPPCDAGSGGFTWSATPNAYFQRSSWGVYFQFGGAGYDDTFADGVVRCVR